MKIIHTYSTATESYPSSKSRSAHLNKIIENLLPVVSMNSQNGGKSVEHNYIFVVKIMYALTQ